MSLRPIHWLILLVVLDLGAMIWLIAGAGEEERADLVFASNDGHRMLDPQRLSWNHDIRVVELLFERLVRMKLPDMVVEPGAAESWDVSDDRRTYTFHLRSDARWYSAHPSSAATRAWGGNSPEQSKRRADFIADGDPVTAGDFIYGWRRAIMPDFAADYSQLFFVIEGAEKFFNWRQEQIASYNLESQQKAIDEAIENVDKVVAAGRDDALRQDTIAKLTRASAHLEYHIDAVKDKPDPPNPPDTPLIAAQAALRRAAAQLESDKPDVAAIRKELEDAKGPVDSARAVFEKLNPMEREARAKAWYDRAGEEFKKTVGVSAPDDRTLVVRLAQPTPYFLELTAFITFSPAHKPSLEAQLGFDGDTGMIVQDPYWMRADRLICNGPYVLERRRFRRDMLMTANPKYWDRANMGNSSILELIVPEKITQLKLYDAGKIDWLPDLPTTSTTASDLLKEQKAGRRNDVHVIGASGTYFYNLNCMEKFLDGTPNPLHDPRVRRALSMCIDRDLIVEKVASLGQRPAYTFTPIDALPTYQPPVEAGVRYDPDGARKLLAEAGYPGGEGLKGIEILYNTANEHERLAQQIAYTWKQELGISVKLSGMEVATFGERLKNHDFVVTRAGWFGDYLDPTTFLEKFQTGNGNNDPGYSNEQFDGLLRQAAGELDQTKRMALLREAEAIMLRDQPIAPIYQYTQLEVFDPDRVKNMPLNAWHFRRLDRVQVIKDQSRKPGEPESRK